MSAITSSLDALGALQVDVDLGGVDALGMLVEFGPAGAAPDRCHLRHLADQALGDQPEAVALGQRDAGVVVRG